MSLSETGKHVLARVSLIYEASAAKGLPISKGVRGMGDGKDVDRCECDGADVLLDVVNAIAKREVRAFGGPSLASFFPTWQLVNVATSNAGYRDRVYSQ